MRNEGYYGLHQWNFEIRGEELVVWNPRSFKSISEEVERMAELTVWNEEGRIFAVLKRRYSTKVRAAGVRYRNASSSVTS